MIKGIWLLAFLFSFVSVSAFATQPTKTPPKKPAPQLAGFGMVTVKHTCSVSYEGCLASCKNVDSASCAEECAADCNVCSLDFGEEVDAICK